MAKYILLFLIIVAFLAFIIIFHKESKSSCFAFAVIWFVLEILTITYSIFIGMNLEQMIIQVGDASQISLVLRNIKYVEIILKGLTYVALFLAVISFFRKETNKQKRS